MEAAAFHLSLESSFFGGLFLINIIVASMMITFTFPHLLQYVKEKRVSLTMLVSAMLVLIYEALVGLIGFIVVIEGKLHDENILFGLHYENETGLMYLVVVANLAVFIWATYFHFRYVSSHVLANIRDKWNNV